MNRRLPLAGLLLLLGPFVAPAAAQKIPPDFRNAFEGRVSRGLFAVVTQKGVPTTSIYGVDGQSTDAYFSVDVKGGTWQTSQGFFDLNQIAADALNLGEVVEIVDVTFKDKDNRIDLRAVSVEAHKVTRGQGYSATTRREPVSTNFKFFFPFPLASARDVPAALEYVEGFLQMHRFEDDAREAAARLLSNGGPAPRAQARSAPASRPAEPAPAVARAASTPAAKKEIKPGMTALQVIDALGKPDQELTFQNQAKWVYPNVTVIFDGGRVKEVRF
jgi:hypothetical protein